MTLNTTNLTTVPLGDVLEQFDERAADEIRDHVPDLFVGGLTILVLMDRDGFLDLFNYKPALRNALSAAIPTGFYVDIGD